VHAGAADRGAGVFVGVSQLEYARITLQQGVAINAYYATGAHLSVTSGRLAYTFGLRGPALTVDTACSSSLVSTHLAARALRAGDARWAGPAPAPAPACLCSPLAPQADGCT
jgi:acyl transferase domain-containing protein